MSDNGKPLIERDYLMGYLWSLCVLSFGIQKYTARREELERELDALSVRRTYVHMDPPRLSISDFKWLPVYIIVLIVLAFIIWAFFIAPLMTQWLGSLFPVLNAKEENPVLEFLIVFITGLPSVALSAGITLFAFSFSRTGKTLRFQRQMKKSNKKALEAFNHEEDLRLQNAPAEIESLESQIQEITGIIAEAQLRLDEFAAQNILHRNYHDPAIIYIILTYFETGAVDTIKEAVNKYDNESRLDAINEKLEKLNNKIDQALDELDKMKVKLNEILERLNRQNSKMDEMNASLKGILRNSAISAAASSALLMIEKDREWRRR